MLCYHRQNTLAVHRPNKGNMATSNVYSKGASLLLSFLFLFYTFVPDLQNSLEGFAIVAPELDASLPDSLERSSHHRPTVELPVRTEGR